MSAIVTFFGRDYTLQCTDDARKFRAALNRLSEELHKPQILSYCGLEIINYPYDIDSVLYTDDIFHVAMHAFRAPDVRTCITDHSTEDIAWTESRNKGLTGIYYRKITFNDDLIGYIAEKIASANAQLDDIDRQFAEKDVAKRECQTAKEQEKDDLMRGVIWDTQEINIVDEGGKTKKYIHYITVHGKTCIITERNIFDFGRVINMDGCMPNINEANEFVLEQFDPDKGWIAVRAGTQEERRAYLLVVKYGKYANSQIRM